MPQSKANNSTKPLTEARMEELLSAQTNAILEAVDERLGEPLDKKLDAKVEPVITQLDAVMKEVQAHRDEDKAGAKLLQRHANKLHDHEVRIKALEARR